MDPLDKMDQSFPRISSQIGANIELLSRNIYNMQRLNQQQPQSDRTQLLRLQHTTNLLARKTNTMLKELVRMDQVNTSPSERRQASFIRDKLTSDFSDALKSLQAVQRAIQANEPTNIVNTHEGSALNQTLFDQQSEQQQQEHQQQQQQQQQHVTVNIEEAREREESVRKLEHDIYEVNQIFKDLATMIHTQGEAVDSIESSIFRATEDVTRGAQEIARAREYQDKSRRKKFYLAMIFFLIMLIVLLVAFVK